MVDCRLGGSPAKNLSCPAAGEPNTGGWRGRKVVAQYASLGRRGGGVKRYKLLLGEPN